jgi:hypothetical protein
VEAWHSGKGAVSKMNSDNLKPGCLSIGSAAVLERIPPQTYAARATTRIRTRFIYDKTFKHESMK